MKPKELEKRPDSVVRPSSSAVKAKTEGLQASKLQNPMDAGSNPARGAIYPFSISYVCIFLLRSVFLIILKCKYSKNPPTSTPGVITNNDQNI